MRNEQLDPTSSALRSTHRLVPQVIDSLAECVHTESFEKKEVLCQQGEVADKFFLIIEGLAQPKVGTNPPALHPTSLFTPPPANTPSHGRTTPLTHHPSTPTRSFGTASRSPFRCSTSARHLVHRRYAWGSLTSIPSSVSTR